MSNNPLLSIIIPVYNVDKYIHKCIESILIQKFTNFEIILINDGSTDKSGDICNQYSNLYEKINVYHKDNEGVSSARNTGIKYSKGDWIFFVDADDWLEIGTLDNLIDTPINIDIIQFGYKKINSENVLYESKPLINKIYNDCNEFQRDSSFKLMNIVFCFYKISLIKNNNIRFSNNIKFGEDLEFSIKIFSLAKGIKQINQCYYNYFEREGSAMKTRITVESIINHLEVSNNLISFFKEKSLIKDKFYNDNLIYFIKSFFSRSVVTLMNNDELRKLQNSYNKFYDINNNELCLKNKLFRLSRININFYRLLLVIRRKIG